MPPLYTEQPGRALQGHHSHSMKRFCRWDTQLLRIDPQSGRLLFKNRRGADVFDTEVRGGPRCRGSDQDTRTRHTASLPCHAMRRARPWMCWLPWRSMR